MILIGELETNNKGDKEEKGINRLETSIQKHNRTIGANKTVKGLRFQLGINRRNGHF